MNTTLEHLNITVTDPNRTAVRLVDLFGWTVRWKGSSMGGTTIHVGGPENGDGYVAIYTTDEPPVETSRSGNIGSLNHIGVVVDDLDVVEQRILAYGFETNTHGDYEPGRRFYFEDEDRIEYEVVSYNR